MLSWLAINYNTARLGLEAQHAAAFRLLRWVGDAGKAASDIPEEIGLPVDSPAAIAVAPKRPPAAKKEPQKISAGSEAGKAGEARLGQLFNLAQAWSRLQSAASNMEQAGL